MPLLRERNDRLEQKEKVIVVGAGIMGLTSAIKLLEEGYEVEIWTKELPGPVSKVASFWEPFASEPDREGRDQTWGEDTYKELVAQTKKGVPGLAIAPGLTIFTGEREAPDWAPYVPSYKHLHDPKDLKEASKPLGVNIPKNGVSGYTVDYPTFDMPPYMEHLIQYFEGLGGKILHRTVSEGLPEAFNEADTVVNCTGLASRDLVFDSTVKAMRGQLVKVTKPAGVDAVVIDDECPDGMRNVMPHANHIMLGGTAEDTSEETPNEQVSADIIKRCTDLVPALKGAQKIETVVGLRPYRSKGIRLEPEDTGIQRTNGKGTKQVIHNYGHGGSGVTFSWGCANEVVRLVNKQK